MAKRGQESVTRKRVTNPSLLDYANLNRSNGFFNDVTIQCDNENKTIAANKLVLSCFSHFFEETFKTNLQERNDNIVSLPSVNGETLKSLIEFIYTGSITISSQNVMFLLSGADYLQLNDVKQFCFEFLLSNVTPANCLEILRTVSQFKNDELINEMHQYGSQKLDKVALSKSFKKLSKDDLISFVENLNRNLAKESSIFHALVTWSHYNETREKEFVDLFKLVRLNNMTAEFLEEVVLEEDLVTSNADCEKAALNAFRNFVFAQRFDEKASQIVIDSTNDIDSTKSKILSLGGVRSSRKVKVVCDLLHELPQKYPDFPEKIESHCLLNLKNGIYCIGGNNIDDQNRFITNTKVLKLDLATEPMTWKQAAPLNQVRLSFGASVFKDSLVVAGGRSGNLLSSAECYTLLTEKWKVISPLNQPRFGNALVAAGGFLYAVGGLSFSGVLSSAERLEDLKSTWINIKPMQKPRNRLAAVNCNDEMYAIGGCSLDVTSSAQKSVEKYNSLSDQWKFVSDMNHARHGHAACTLCGKIYVIGGIGQNHQTVKEIECYDPSSDAWVVVGSTEDELRYHAVVVV